MARLSRKQPPAPALYLVGMQVRMPAGKCGVNDDGLGNERYTLQGTLGEITSADWCPGQGWTYGVVFRNGGWINYLEEEIDQGHLEFLFGAPKPTVYWQGQLPTRRYGVTAFFLSADYTTVDAASPEDAIQEARTYFSEPRNGHMVRIEVSDPEVGDTLLTEDLDGGTRWGNPFRTNTQETE